MILDFACDIKNCAAPVEFVKGTNYQTLGGAVKILFLRCLNKHYYMKYKEDIPELNFLTFKLNNDNNNLNYNELIVLTDDDEFIQPELPFEDE